MTFNKVYSSLQKVRQSSQILFHSPLSTSPVPEESIKRRNEVFHITLTLNGKCKTLIVQRPYGAFSSKERHIHISACKQFCIEGEEKKYSDKKGDESFRENEQASTQNKKSEVNKIKSGFFKKRCFYKIRHQNLVWDGSNKKNKLSKYKMFPTNSEVNKKLAEKMLNNTHNVLYENSELKSEKENKNSKMQKAQESSSKNILTIDICHYSDNHPPQFKTLSEDNIKTNSKINSKITPEINNSYKLISSKEVAGNSYNNKKIENDNAFRTRSRINDLDKSNLALLKQNKIPMNGIVLKKKYKPTKEIKNIMEQENSHLLHNKDHCTIVSGKKSTDNIMAYKMTDNSLQNKSSKELIKKENSKCISNSRSKLGIVENKDNSDQRKNFRTDEGKETVRNTVYKQIKPQLMSNGPQYLTKLQNNFKNIDLNKKYKFASSINTILRPIKSQAQMPSEQCGYQLLPKNVNNLIVNSVNSLQNISQPMSHSSNLVMDNTLHMKLMKIGTCLNEPMQNSRSNYPLLNVSRDNVRNKIKLMKDINSASLNKKAMVTALKCEIKSWKKYEHLKKVFLESTSHIYHSIMDRRRTGKITKSTVYIPRKKTKKKCKIISVPITPKININKCQKTIQTHMKTNCLKYQTSFASKSDPIMTLNLKYKKNYQTTYKDLLKKNEMLIFLDKFKINQGILEYDSNKEFQIENKSGITDNIKKIMFKRNNFKKADDKDVKVFKKRAKKVSLENKRSLVRFMHQLNDESNEESLKISEISTYPSGCLKKPEFIIEILPFEEEHFGEMVKATQSNISDSQTNKQNFNIKNRANDSKELCWPILNQSNELNEKLESNIIAEPTNKFKFNKADKECEYTKVNLAKFVNTKEKPFSISGLSKIKSESLYDNNRTVIEQNHGVYKKKYTNQKSHNVPLNQEHCLSNESSEEIEPKANTNETVNHLLKEDDEKLTEVGLGKPLKINNSVEFQTEENLGNKILNKINSNCNIINQDKSLRNYDKTFTTGDDQLLTNNIKLEVSNNIYEPLIQNINNQALSKKNMADVEKDHPKFTISSLFIEENKPSKDNSFIPNQPECLRTDTSRQIKSIPLKQSTIEILFDSSQPQSSVSKEHNQSQETQIKHLSTTSSSKAESKNNMELFNNCANQNNSIEISKLNEYEIVKNSCRNEHFPKDDKLQESSFDQNVSNLDNQLENIKNTQKELLGEEKTIPKDANKKGFVKKVNPPHVILSSNEKNIKKNITNNLESQNPFLENDLQKSQQNQNMEQTENLQKFRHHSKQSNNNKIENMNTDINESKLFGHLKKSYPEISSSNYNNIKAFIDNIKDFFCASCSYFKFYNTEGEAFKNNVISNSHHSEEKNMFHNMNDDVLNSFREANLSSKESQYFPKSDKLMYTSSNCGMQDFYQKGINCNGKRNKTKLLPPYLYKHRKEDIMLNKNEEFERKFLNKSPVYQKGDFSMTSENLENLITNEDISINDLNIGKNNNSTYHKNSITNTNNIPGKNNHHSSFLNKIIDKNFEAFYVNPDEQQDYFCSINHNKCSSYKNRFYNQKPKHKYAEGNVNNIRNKLSGFHYCTNSNLPIDDITHLEKSRRNRRNELTPFKCKIGLKPIMENNIKFKKDYYNKLHSKSRILEKSNLPKSLQSIQKLREENNPEALWLNCLAKNTCTEDKPTCNEFLTYIKKRKLPRKPSFKCD